MKSYPFLSGMPFSAIDAYFAPETENFRQRVFLHWEDLYFRRSSIYYRMRLSTLENFLIEQFLKAHNGYYPDSLEYGEELWNDFTAPYSLSYVTAETHDFLFTTSRFFDFHGCDGLSVVTDKEMLQSYIDVMRAGGHHPNNPMYANLLFEAWFNHIINNRPEEIKRLRSMPYQEYLRTQHWERVRVAMIIAHNARCESGRCYGRDGYYGDEKWLHVHHVSYKNRGNERFADLRLLCDECHKRLHAGEAVLDDHSEALYKVALAAKDNAHITWRMENLEHHIAEFDKEFLDYED